MFNVKYLLFIPFILIFLQGFVIFLTSVLYYPLNVFLLPIIFSLLFLFKGQKMLNHFMFLYKKTPFKYLMFLFAWIVFTGLIAVINGYYPINRFLFVVVLGLIFKYLLLYLYPTFVIPRFFSLNTIIKLFSIAYFVIFSFGIIQFLGAYYNINFITVISNILSNAQVNDISSVVTDAVSGIPRIKSFFVEPSEFGLFITVNLPIIYTLCLTKYKIFDSSLLNTVVKRFTLFLLLISTILIQSPIYILFIILFSLLFFSKAILNLVKRYISILPVIILLGLLTILLFLFFLKFNFSNSFLNRIFVVVSVLLNFDLDAFIKADNSFATRIISFLHQFLLFLKHPFWGIGFGNNGPLVIKQMMSSNIPLSGELMLRLYNADNSVMLNSNPFYLLLHQTGFLGVFFYVLFYIKNIKYLNFYKRDFSGIEYQFINGIKVSLVFILIISILYTMDLYMQIVVFLQGLVCSIVTCSYRKKQ